MRRRVTPAAWLLVVALGALAGVAGCAKSAPLPVLVPGAERYPDFPRPDVPPALAGVGQAARNHDRGWVQLQLGDPKAAERTFRGILQRTPAFYPSQAALGFTRLATRDTAAALTAFDGALARRGDYLPALVGRAEALLELGREGEAFAAYNDILSVAPDHPVAARRVEVLRLRAVQADVALGRTAMAARDYAAARAALERAVAASPDSAFLHRDLARIAVETGNDEEALTRTARALALDPRDAESWALQGRLKARRGEVEAGLDDLRRAARLDPGLADVAGTIAALEAELAEALLPAEFKAIPTQDSVTRGDLAALLAHHLPGLLEPRRPTVLITDARRHWAQQAILQVIRAGVMTEYANHTFQPGSLLTRGDLAVAVDRVLALVAERAPAAARAWQDARLSFPDLRPGNLLYLPVSRAVASGALPPSDGRPFGARQRASGAEAAAAVERLAHLARGAGLGIAATRPGP